MKNNEPTRYYCPNGHLVMSKRENCVVCGVKIPNATHVAKHNKQSQKFAERQQRIIDAIKWFFIMFGRYPNNLEEARVNIPGFPGKQTFYDHFYSYVELIKHLDGQNSTIPTQNVQRLTQRRSAAWSAWKGKYSKKELIQMMIDFKKKHGREIMQSDVAITANRHAYGLPHHMIYYNNFGSFSKAKDIAYGRIKDVNLES